MLEKQKVWLSDKTEKGKKWMKDHKVAISATAGYVAGIAATIGTAYLVSKIFENKKEVFQIFCLDSEYPGDFAVGKVGTDRFGKEHIGDITYLKAEDKELIFNNIEAAIAETKALREKA